MSCGLPSAPRTGLPFSSSFGRCVDRGGHGQRDSRPARRTTTWTGVPVFARICFCTCAQLLTGRPSKRTISSPACRPAAAAGATGSELVQGRCGRGRRAVTHWLTDGTTGTVVGTPKPDTTMAEEEEREQEVHDRAAEHDDEPLRHGPLVEEPVGVLGRDLALRVLPGLLGHACPAARAVGALRAVRLGGNMPIMRT